MSEKRKQVSKERRLEIPNVSKTWKNMLRMKEMKSLAPTAIRTICNRNEIK